ncbi:hypothetical protein PAXRUDRAFT_11499 [Paxillus rubicundulus Ve08.2h10]|uniref:Uncharacterized protein n=1 Tax=Paxillus rubicundulus Ve08.2h10 TaxID=930991 RepID=A0A0D0DYM1_9AGAM|nr:hypothetical protein PAXRUDRAFT_11499 [Paxillus rubicundulus Ve08.2h10]
MSLRDLGKNDISEETQAFKDRLASQDTQNAGLRTCLMRREAELEEIKASLDETLYKLSKEADRVFRLENDLAARSSELKTERMSLRNAELALESAQEKLKAEERTSRELEATLDTISLHSQTTTKERQSIEREKRALESRVRELERIVQTHEAQVTALKVPRKGGRPRSSSASSFLLPAVEQELSDAKAQLAVKERSLHVLEDKLARAHDDLVRAENARISVDKVSQKRISELISTLEQKEEEIEALQENWNSGEREEELLKRIDEDEAKIAALEKLVGESQANQANRATVNQLQSRLNAEAEKLHRTEERQNDLLREKEELVKQFDASRREIAQSHQLLRASERQIGDLETRQDQLQAELTALRRQAARKKGPEIPDAIAIDRVLDTTNASTGCSTTQSETRDGVPADADESALADRIETLLQAIDRLRNERDELKRALEFSEVEYRITSEGFQARIALLTKQLSERPDKTMAVESEPRSRSMDLARMKHLASCATTFSIVISNLQSHLELTGGCLSTVRADLASSDSCLRETLTLVDRQKQYLGANEREHEFLLKKLETLAEELSQSEHQRSHSSRELRDLQAQIDTLMARCNASEAARKEAQDSLALVEEQFTTLGKSYQGLESNRNSLALQITNLQDDLVLAQDELADAQNRYSALQAQQLSDMSTSEVIHALKDRIQELEMRVLRRTEQIGIHQHDIRRLETNLKLQEERVAEMTSELELLASQKEAMVEDCAEAREARDEAIQNSEAAEEKVERLEEQMQHVQHDNEAELASMSSTVAKLTCESHQATTRLVELEATNAELIRQLDFQRAERQRVGDQLNASATHAQSLEAENSGKDGEIYQATMALAVVYRAWKHFSNQLQASCHHTASMQAQLAALSQELKCKDDLIFSAGEEKRILHQQLADLSAASELASSTNAEQHRIQYDGLREELAALHARLQETTSELSIARATSQEHQEHQHLQQTRILREELSELKLQLRDADSLRASLHTMTEDMTEARQLLQETEVRHAEAEAELEQRIVVMSQRLQHQDEVEKKFVDAQTGQLEEIALLQVEFSDAKAKLQASQENFAELDKLYREVLEDFSRAKEVFEHCLAETEERIHGLHTDHQSSLAAIDARHRHEVDLLASNLEDREHEVDGLRQQLQDASEAHSDLESDLRHAIADMGRQLEQAEAESHALQEEKQLLQAQIPDLEAEIQRALSLTRYLECQLRESESACTSLKGSLQQSQLSFAESEKAGKAAELNLALQATQHERVLSALRRELASLQSGPDLRTALAELKERNQEMDDLLKAKCQEIEEYDDRILETLKVNKKLTSKVDSLARKVQSLQAKLASMKSQPQEPMTQPVAQRVSVQEVTLPPVPPAPPIRPSLMNAGAYSPLDPVVSGPSSTTLRPKTPDAWPQQTFTLAPSHTPDHKSKPLEFGSVSAGKKRPASDDDERDSVPPEGHYSTDAYFRHASTPRLRRAQGHQVGFTPVRGGSERKILGLPSPGRRVITAQAIAPSEVITDVTNSPRGLLVHGDSQGKKRSWLGKLRGGAVSASNKPWGSRPNAFDGR